MTANHKPREETALFTALKQTLEGTAFMEVVHPEADATAAAAALRQASILVTAPQKQRLYLRLPEGLLHQLATIVYAEMEQLKPYSRQLLDDLLKELTNTLAGHYLASILAADAVFHLDVPQICTADNSTAPDIQVEAECGGFTVQATVEQAE